MRSWPAAFSRRGRAGPGRCWQPSTSPPSHHLQGKRLPRNGDRRRRHSRRLLLLHQLHRRSGLHRLAPGSRHRDTDRRPQAHTACRTGLIPAANPAAAWADRPRVPLRRGPSPSGGVSRHRRAAGSRPAAPANASYSNRPASNNNQASLVRDDHAGTPARPPVLSRIARKQRNSAGGHTGAGAQNNLSRAQPAGNPTAAPAAQIGGYSRAEPSPGPVTQRKRDHRAMARGTVISTV